MLTRGDAHGVLGGDTVQMLQTKAALEQLGVCVETGSVQEECSTAGFDLIHIFNWQQLPQYLALRKPAAGKNPPIVLSPIFWFFTGNWFDTAVTTKKAWRLLNARLGSMRARQLYEQWQQVKFRHGVEGQTLRRALAVPAQLLPNSDIEIDHLESVLGLQGKLRARCTVVPNAVRKELFDPPPPPNQAFRDQYGLQGYVLEVARIQSAKNQLGLMEALFDVPVPIVFAGQPSPYETEYVNRCYALAQKRGQVYFLGPMSAEALVDVYAAAAVHVLPSWRETPGLVSLEAAATGCRIVSTSIGSAREYLGEHAWYCDPRDPQSIRQAVLQALESPPSNSLRKRVLERYTWEAAAAATLQAYHSALVTNVIE